MLKNGNFEQDWGKSHEVLVCRPGRSPTLEIRDNIFTPESWLTWFYHTPDAPIDERYSQPEVKDAWKHVDPRRVHTGEKGVLFFTFYRRHLGGLLQQVSVEPGKRYEAKVYAHAWSNHDDTGFPHPHDGRWSEGAGYDEVSWAEGTQPHDTLDPQQDAKANFTFSVGIDPTGGLDPMSDTVIWGDGFHIYNGYVKPITVKATARGDIITVFLRSKTLWTFCHTDAYFDDVTLVESEDEPSDYDCVTLVLPQDATQEQLGEILRLAYPDRRSFMFSHDDAGRLGGLAQLYNILSVDKQRYLDWYSARYPQTTVEFVYTSDWDEEPPPPPPPPPVPVFISFQQQRAAEYRDEFISRVQPPAWLLIGGFEEARHLKSLAPNMEIAIRHVDNDWKSYVMASDKDAAAERWLKHHGQTLFDQAEYIDWVLDLNEYTATNDYESLRATPSWTEALIKCFAREGWPARIIGWNVPVGNPQHNYLCDEQGIPRQIPILIPAARLLTDNKCKIGYHTYWGIRRLGDGRYYSTLDQPASMRMHYAFRALLSWDPVFTAAGVYPEYAFTEGGPIYINEAGAMVSSGAGWKYRETFNGDVDACVASYMQFQSLIQEWNTKHSNRARWLTGFLHGGFTEWRHFDMAGEPSRKLADALT